MLLKYVPMLRFTGKTERDLTGILPGFHFFPTTRIELGVLSRYPKTGRGPICAPMRQDF